MYSASYFGLKSDKGLNFGNLQEFHGGIKSNYNNVKSINIHEKEQCVILSLLFDNFNN